MKQIDEQNVKELRRRIFSVAYSGGMAHLASCFSSVEILYTLYLKGILRVDPKQPERQDRDRFVLSKGHAALALYAVLEMAGFVTREELDSYLKPGATVGGEPNLHDLRGIEASTGSLGHGLSIAVGMAMAQKYDESDARTVVLIGDGESQEGSIWEAAMSASSFELDNLVAILDCNMLQKTGRVDETMKVIQWEAKWEAFGWNVLHADGHDPEDILKAFSSLQKNGRPTILIARTVKGKGVSIMENDPRWHYKMPNKKELKVFLRELELSEEEMEALKC